ncbi:type VII secretion protein EccB [Micromonospora sp. NPDC004336]
MLTRRDLIHSRQFLQRRLHTALVAQRPDPLEWSGTRLPGVTLAAVMLVVICLAGAGIYGYFRPAGAKSWTACDRVILEKETGSAYVCDGRTLYPVLNFSSAALLRGLANPPVSVNRASLTWPRGHTVGVPDAPNAIPTARDLLAGPWSFCMRPAEPGAPARSVVVVGERVAAGAPLADEAVAVTDPVQRQLSIVYKGRRHAVTDRAAVTGALAVTTPDVLTVSSAWLATLPVGPELGAIGVAGRGGAVARLPGVRVGQLLTSTVAGNTLRYVARPSGVQPITALQEALIRATAKDTAPSTVVNPVQLAGATILEPLAEAALGDGAVPPVVPAARSRGAVCQIVSGGSDEREITVGAVPEPRPAAARTGGVNAAGTLLADEVLVAAGRGALVRAQPSPTAETGPVYLVTETGRRYPVGSATALERLGLPGAAVVRMPSTLVERLPQGPVLDAMNMVSAVP